MRLAAARLLAGRVCAQQRLQAAECMAQGSGCGRTFVAAAQQGVRTADTIPGADRAWKLVRSFLGGCVAAPVGMLTYYYWQDPDMTKAYLRYRLQNLRHWVSGRPDLNRLEEGLDMPAPRLGRTGLGPIGPRSAHPITPFRLFDQHGQLRTNGELLGERSMLLLVHPGPVDEKDPAMRRYARILEALDKTVEDTCKRLRPVLVAPDIQADERGLARLKQVLKRFEGEVRRPGHRIASLLGLAGGDAAQVAQRAADARAPAPQSGRVQQKDQTSSMLYLVNKTGNVREQASMDQQEEEILDTLLEVILEEM